MTRGVGSYPCEDCRRTFGGQFAFDTHRVDGECLPAGELRKRRLHRRPDGIWVQRYAPQEPRQRRLFRVGRPRRRKTPQTAPGANPTTNAAPSEGLGQSSIPLFAEASA